MSERQAPGYCSANIWVLSREDIPAMWGYIAGFLEGKKGGILDNYTVEALALALMLRDDTYLWLAVNDTGKIEGLMVVALSTGTIKTDCWIVGINCVDIRKYLPYIGRFEKWALYHDVTDIVLEGKGAWARFLRRYGYQSKTVIMRKNIRRTWSN